MNRIQLMQVLVVSLFSLAVGTSCTGVADTQESLSEAKSTPQAPTNLASEEPTKVVEIPLEQIWALNMPGTKDIRELNPIISSRRGESPADTLRRLNQSPLQQIQRSLRALIRKEQESPRKQMPASFIVEGVGQEAFDNLFNQLVKEKKAAAVFSTRKPISLVFFTKSSGLYIHLEAVRKQENKITLLYRFVPHRTKETTQHLALIPLGKISPGELVVDILPPILDERFKKYGISRIDANAGKQLTSNSFSLTIQPTLP